MPGKIYNLSDLENFELPPIPSQAAKAAEKKQAEAAKTAETAPAQPAAAANSADNSALPPLPAKKPAEAPANAESGDGFDLPPLPKKKPADKTAESTAAASPAKAPASAQTESDGFDLPPLPKKKLADKAAESSAEAPAQAESDGFDLPPLPKKKPADKAAESSADAPAQAESDGFDLPPLPKKKPAEEAPAQTESDGYDLPPLPEKKPEKAADDNSEAEEYPAEEYYEQESSAGEDEYYTNEEAAHAPEPEPKREEKAPAPRVSLEEDYDVDLSTVTPQDIGIDDPSKALAPMHSAKEAKARNAREKMKMDDLAMNMDVPVLDDLSDEYAAPEKRADDLLERDHLESDEKQVLKQRLQEDLGRRPENFNARASRNMYNKLMEEKKLKIAKKGMMLSFIPIIMQLIAAGLCYLKMNWGNYEWFQYVAVFGVASAVLLLIKSKHTKMFSIIITAMTVLMYVGPGLVMYALDDKMQAQPDYVVHIVCAAAASLLNVGAILILTKNEPINIYYTTKFRRKN